MPHVLELGILLLLFPPRSKVTKREHSKRKGTMLKTRKVTRKTMRDFQSSFAKILRETCRQIVPHSMLVSPVIAKEVVRVSLLAGHGTDSVHPRSPVWRVPPPSRYSFQPAKSLNLCKQRDVAMNLLQSVAMVPFHTPQTAKYAPTEHRAHQLAPSPHSAQQQNSGVCFSTAPQTSTFDGSTTVVERADEIFPTCQQTTTHRLRTRGTSSKDGRTTTPSPEQSTWRSDSPNFAHEHGEHQRRCAGASRGTP